MGIYTTVSGVDNRTVSIALRLIIAAVCVFLIAKAISDNRFKINGLFATFLILYFIRLVYEYSYQNNDYALVAIQFYLLSVAIPAIAVGSYSEYLLLSQKRIVFLLSFSGVLFLPAYFYAFKNGLLFTQGTDEFNVRYAAEAVNAVSLGHVTCTIAIASFFYLIEYRPRLTLYAVLATVLAGAGVALFLSGARAGIVGLVVAAVVYAVARPSRLAILLPFALGGLMYLPQDHYLVKRMNDLVNAQWDKGSLARLEVQSTAISDFIDSPIVGKHFIDMSWGPGLYPHNILIEILMALGLIGAVPLYLIFGMSIYRAIKFRADITFYTIIYMVSFAFLQTSGAIWSAGNLFVLTSVFLATSNNFVPSPLAGLPRSNRTVNGSVHAHL
ncbi:MAG: O-antigen ligase domain-containing protein [Mesorhizobium sp.]|nr:MAG: O-antigen ligase domain-containing protein [Mesorhizobium sp.]